MKTIKSEMVDFPFVIEPSMTLAEAQTFMTQQKLRHLPVVDSSNKLLGVVSERDILKSKRPNDVITSVMVKDPFVVHENEDLIKVLETMVDEKYGSVLVVNSAHELTGIFTTVDALALLVSLLKKTSNISETKKINLLDLLSHFQK